MEETRQPEVYAISYAEMVKASNSKELIVLLMKKECICGHAAYFHVTVAVRNPHRMEDQFVFKQCNVACPCDMFKLDNLRYLEDIVERREHEGL